MSKSMRDTTLKSATALPSTELREVINEGNPITISFRSVHWKRTFYIRVNKLKGLRGMMRGNFRNRYSTKSRNQGPRPVGECTRFSKKQQHT